MTVCRECKRSDGMHTVGWALALYIVEHDKSESYRFYRSPFEPDLVLSPCQYCNEEWHAPLGYEAMSHDDVQEWATRKRFA